MPPVHTHIFNFCSPGFCLSNYPRHSRYFQSLGWCCQDLWKARAFTLSLWPCDRSESPEGQGQPEWPCELRTHGGMVLKNLFSVSLRRCGILPTDKYNPMSQVVPSLLGTAPRNSFSNTQLCEALCTCSTLSSDLRICFLGFLTSQNTVSLYSAQYCSLSENLLAKC